MHEKSHPSIARHKHTHINNRLAKTVPSAVHRKLKEPKPSLGVNVNFSSLSFVFEETTWSNYFGKLCTIRKLGRWGRQKQKGNKRN